MGVLMGSVYTSITTGLSEENAASKESASWSGRSTSRPRHPRASAAPARLGRPSSVCRSTDWRSPSKNRCCHMASHPSDPLLSTTLTEGMPSCACVMSSPTAYEKPPSPQIGRASCRERAEVHGGGVGVWRKEEDDV